MKSLCAVAVLSISLMACSSSPSSTSGSTSASIDASATTLPADTTPPTEVTPAEPLTIDELISIGRPIVLAHAGGNDEHPHSTPYAYADSVKAGVDMLDFDVQLTKDGVLVVQHNEDTGSNTEVNVVIADTNYADLAKLDNAYWFTKECTCHDKPEADYILRGMRTGTVPPLAGYTPDDFIIPRFRDIVERFPSMPLNIEIKGVGDKALAAAKELAAELTELNRLKNAVVTSFHDEIVTAFHELAPTVEVTPGLALATAFILNKTPLPAGMRILQLPPDYSGVHVLSPESIALSKASGYVIWVWPDDGKWENLAGYSELLAMGLEGLNGSRPSEAVAAVKAFVPG